VSPEAVLAVGASPSPAPAGSPASLGAGGSGGSSAGGTGAGFGGGPGAGIPQGPAGGAAERSAPSPSGQHGESADSGEIHASVGKGPRARAAQPSTPAQRQSATQAGPNFSQTLAQSLAAPAHTPAPPRAAAPVTARAAKPAKASAAHSSDRTRKPDPVSSAMAMVHQAVPVAPATTIVHAGEHTGHGATQTAQAMRAESPHAAASKDERPAVHAAMAAQVAGEGADAPQSASAQPVKPGARSVSALNNGAMLAAGHLATGPHAGAPAARASATLSEPVGTSGWTRQLGAQLTWLARQGIQSASLRVAPQHLGPVQVSISVHHGEASVWFGAAEAQTRQALTRALPELHAMFASQGLALTDSGVSHDAPRDPRRTLRQGQGAIGELGAPESGASGSSGAPAGIGLIDTYA
jgi:flagellar hook-length control protein FliK